MPCNARNARNRTVGLRAAQPELLLLAGIGGSTWYQVVISVWVSSCMCCRRQQKHCKPQHWHQQLQVDHGLVFHLSWSGFVTQKQGLPFRLY
jgi:hypothetical protein